MEVTSYTKTHHHDVYSAIDPSCPELSAAGKVVLITGGGRGIGNAITKAFATAGAADVVVLGRTEISLKAIQSEIQFMPRNKSRIHTFVADITDEAKVNEVFAKVVKTIGRIDVYVANAGSIMEVMPFANAPIDLWWKQFEVNVKGSAIVAQAFLKSATENAVLISINTFAAQFRYFAPMSSYAASKVALARLMDHIAMENINVRVYNLHPGNVNTDMSKETGMVMPSYDTPELAAATCVYLASPLGETLRGKFIWANWDVEEMEANLQAEADPNFLTIGLIGSPFQHKAIVGG